MPDVEDDSDVTINPDDLRIDTFRAGGHGGQNVQKNSTAVRITHIPSGIRVSCQNERSQHQNREIAMRILMARLVELGDEETRRGAGAYQGRAHFPGVGQSDQELRAPSLPDVKDHRTDHSVSDAAAVLDGDLDDFITSYLKTTVGKKPHQ